MPQLKRITMNTRKLSELISFIFIILFVYAATSKLLDIQKFYIQLQRSSILSRYVIIIVWFIPALELAISVLLAIRRFRKIALYASYTLMLLFTEYIIAITHFTPNVPCSCGGILQNLSWDQHLIFNIAFILLGLFGILLPAEKLASI
jgi:hypothetical protein